jgi:hypothetical protein
VAQIVECLSSKSEAMSSNLSTVKTKKSDWKCIVRIIIHEHLAGLLAAQSFNYVISY